ncbi:FGGY-family carbohydrate kinase [Microbacterium sp. NPDC089180]|uniref:FGGY-family carbohydrate kinase n=1 Tax=unclassified Microbacterium TaxID=2609290 RepID=UPI003438AAE3
MTPAVLGIDAGTTAVKAVLYSLEGETLAAGHRSVAVVRTADGGAESDIDLVWEAVVGAVRQALSQARSAGPDVVAVGVTGQGDGAWLVDAEGRPVRPAALWLDGRGADRVTAWQHDGRDAAVVSATGSASFPGTLPVLLDVFADTEPDVLARAAHHLNCKDAVRQRLTGEIATDPSEASRTYLDPATLAYSDDMIDALGHRRFAHLLAPVRAPHERGGALTASAAEELGLRAGVPVAVGLVDSAACPVGLGALSDQDGWVVLGTTATVAVNRVDRAAADSGIGILIPTGRGTQVLEALSSMVGTPNLDWARDTLGLSDRGWSELERLARTAPDGSGGVVYLPYGSPSGERAPFVDAAASASWVGTTVATTPAQLLRSVFEGLAFSVAECLDLLDAGDRVPVCGGGARSDLMCQLLADVSQRTIVRTADPEVGARGAATLAVVAAGLAPDLEAAVRVFPVGSVEFAPRASPALSAARDVFARVRAALRPEWPALRALARTAANADGVGAPTPDESLIAAERVDAAAPAAHLDATLVDVPAPERTPA